MDRQEEKSAPQIRHRTISHDAQAYDLTKREHIACLMMQALTTRYGGDPDNAQSAVRLADKLIAALNDTTC